MLVPFMHTHDTGNLDRPGSTGDVQRGVPGVFEVSRAVRRTRRRRETPAHKYEDGQEYVPAKKPVLLGHHYSSIAGGAPIVGPITAGVVWGWVPALAWIAIGNPLMGSVHDFVSLSASLRHEGRSIGYIIGEYVGERGKNMLLWFAFLTIILVVAVFALVVAIVFDAFPQVTTASFVYIVLALVFGVYLYQLNGPFLPGTVLFVAGVFAGVYVGF